jgi:hypothetical protein
MELPYLETHLVDNCNLKCKGCSHFSPLFPENSYARLDTFVRDFSRLQTLFENIKVIRLMGGEPLLHPKVIDFLEVARGAFPDAWISIVTNGILLLKQADKFWKTCADKNILIQVSRYPIKLDINRIKVRVKQFKVDIEIFSPKSFLKKINLAGDSDIIDSFQYCKTIFECAFLRNGKISPCSFPPLVFMFNKSFWEKIPTKKNDFIDIHDPRISGSDIIEFVNRPIPMCKWCLTRRPIFSWDTSERKVDEWVSCELGYLKHFFYMSQFRIFKKINAVKTLFR